MRKSIELKQLKRVRYWSEAEGRAAVEGWRASGLTVVAFAAKCGLAPTRIKWWRQRLDGGAAGPAVASMAPVDIIGAAAAAPSSTSTIDVLVRGGRVVRVTGDVDAAALARVVLALESLC